MFNDFLPSIEEVEDALSTQRKASFAAILVGLASLVAVGVGEVIVSQITDNEKEEPKEG